MGGYSGYYGEHDHYDTQYYDDEEESEYSEGEWDNRSVKSVKIKIIKKLLTECGKCNLYFEHGIDIYESSWCAE